MKPQQFRKKPVVIEAMQFTGMLNVSTKGSLGVSEVIQWIHDNGGTARWHEAVPPRLHSEHCRCDGMGIIPGAIKALPCPETEPKGPGKPEHIAIDTLEGTMKASVGDWIIRGVQGEFYACKPDIFEATYERFEVEPI